MKSVAPLDGLRISTWVRDQILDMLSSHCYIFFINLTHLANAKVIYRDKETLEIIIPYKLLRHTVQRLKR